MLRWCNRSLPARTGRRAAGRDRSYLPYWRTECLLVRTAGKIHRKWCHPPARLVHGMDACRLIARGIRFHYVPIEQGECLIKVGDAGEVRAEDVGPAAVPVSDSRVDEWNSYLVRLIDTVFVVVDKRPRVNVGLPLLYRNISHIDRLVIPIRDIDRCGEAIHQLIVPLIEDAQPPASAGDSGEREVPVGVALGEHEIFTIGVAQAD